MKLDVNGRVIANPTTQHIADAIDTKPDPDGWYINLDAGDGTSVEGFADKSAMFRIVYAQGKRRSNAAAAIDAAQLKTLFTKFLKGDPSWRNECLWASEAKDGTADVAASGRQPPAWAIVLIVGSIVAVPTIVWLLQSGALRSVLPFADSDAFYIGLIFLPMVVVVVVAIAAYLLEARRAARWLPIQGQVVKSGVVARHHKFSDEATTVTNAPDIEYTFIVNGRTYRGTRVGIGEEAGGANTAATVGRYPVGATVTVYYDPANPKNCLLERDAPAGIAKGCIIGLAVLAGLGAAIYFAIAYGYGFLQARMPDPSHAPVVIFASCFGLVVLLFFFAARRASKQAMTWPSVRGTIVSTGTEAVEKHEDGRTRTYYTPAVEYAYHVNGLEYRSRQINISYTTSGSSTGAEKVAARYPQGSEVEVHYDPANPSNAALNNPTGFTWILLIIALACFGVAAYASGLFAG